MTAAQRKALLKAAEVLEEHGYNHLAGQIRALRVVRDATTGDESTSNSSS